MIEALSSIGVPTLVVVGELDEAFLADSRYLAEKIPGAELAVIAGAGHVPPLTHPKEFNGVARLPLPPRCGRSRARAVGGSVHRRVGASPLGGVRATSIPTSCTKCRRPESASAVGSATCSSTASTWDYPRRVVLGDNRRAVVWFAWRAGDGPTTDGIAFFEVADGMITGITDFWPEPYEPPPGREHLTERY